VSESVQRVRVPYFLGPDGPARIQRYGLSPEEYLSWQRVFDATQQLGPLAATTLKDHRD
jgi:hypothetical protein